MSIFKDTFRPYVRKQLSLREELIAIGNTNDQGIRTNRDSKQPVTLQTGDKIELHGGAYYNYTLNKQCILRMTSMVDYVENVGLEIGGLEGEQSFNALRGASLSQNFILEGGVLSDFARTRNEKREVRRATTPRDSFPRQGQRTNLGYGDLAIGAEASSDGYGIVPMPGITDANIRTKSAYGSLREAKVNFVCHNRRQLEVLEMLYMRPGYMVTLEWGWNPYINNGGELVTETRLLEDMFLVEGGKSLLYTNSITQQDVFNAVNKLKEYHCGNYDGMLGFVKNFGFQAREDGGFDCYTELTSIGEVIESLKIPNLAIVNPVTSLSTTSEDVNGQQSNITVSSNFGSNKIGRVDEATFNTALEQGIFPRYNGLLGLVKSLYNYSIFNEWEVDGQRLYVAKDSEGQNDIINEIFPDYSSETYDAADKDRKKELNEIKESAMGTAEKSGYDSNARFRSYLGDLVRYQATSLGQYLINTLQLQDPGDILNYIVPVGGKNNQSFIRWDAFCTLINENLITKDEKANTPVFITSDRVYDLGDNTARLDPLLFTAISDYTDSNQNNLIDYSCDVNVCILPLQFETNTLASEGGNVDTFGVKESLGYIPDTTLFPTNYIAGVYDRGLDLKYDGQSLKAPADFTGPIAPNPVKLKPNDKLRRIGSIFLNINMINNIAEKNADEEDYTLGQFLTDIWDEVNKACPNHNFVLTDDKESNTVFVIDLPVDGSEVPKDLHEFIPFSNKNILRQFQYTSNVPKAMSATVAIQAQDPRSIQDIDGVTFAAFNRSIKNRILSKDTTSNYTNTVNQIRNRKSELISRQNKTRQQVNEYVLGFFRNLRLIANDKTPSFEGNIKGITKEYQSNATYLSQALSKAQTFTSVIPLEFSATLDGISGIVIGNLFKVQKDRLPRAYSRANIGFIVFSEDQKITNGQDWTTEISGKMTLLPTEESPIKIDGYITNTFTEEKLLTEESTVSYNSETTDIDETQSRGTDIIDATAGESVYLKKIKDNSITDFLIPGIYNDWDVPSDLPNVFKGKRVERQHGFTTVRSSPEIDNGIKGFNNVIGLFEAWNPGDNERLLGIVKAKGRSNNPDYPDGIAKIPLQDGKVRLLPSTYGAYFDTTDERWVKKDESIFFTPEKINGSTTTTINGEEYYVITEALSGADMYSISLNGDEETTVGAPQIVKFNDKTTKRYIRKSDTTGISSIWYNLEFDPSADDKFYNGWSRRSSYIDVGSATKSAFSYGGVINYNASISEWSKNNDCWMRFDTLAATADSAVGPENIQILETNPEFPEENESKPSDDESFE